MYDDEARYGDMRAGRGVVGTTSAGDRIIQQHWYDEPPYESDPEDFLMGCMEEDDPRHPGHPHHPRHPHHISNAYEGSRIVDTDRFAAILILMSMNTYILRISFYLAQVLPIPIKNHMN